MSSLVDTIFNKGAADIHTTLSVLQRMNVTLNEKNTSLIDENTYLKEKLSILQLKHFGRKSEKLMGLPGDQLVFNEIEALTAQEEPEVITVAEHTKKARGKRSVLPDHLERRETIVDLSPEQKVCPEQHPLTRIGEEVHEHMEMIPAQMFVVVTKRQKYACKTCEGSVKTAEALPTILPKTNCGPGLLAYIIASKYCDHLPLYRLENIFSRIDVELSRQTLARWAVAAALKLTPVMNLLEEMLLESTYLQMDETRIQVIGEKKKSIESKKYVWTRRRPGEHPIIIYDYDPSRGGEVPLRLLNDYHGVLQVDGYAGYDPVIEKQNLIRLGCMAHLRRYFYEVYKASKNHKNLANQVLQFIKKICAVEELARKNRLLPDARKELRLKEAVPLLHALKLLIDESAPKYPSQSAIGKALTYATNQWAFILTYLSDGRLEIDNNGVENAIRPFVIGRKNWLFSATVEGAKASCIYYSLIQTAKENNIEPFGYLRDLFEKLPYAKELTDYQKLLPLPAAAINF